MLYIYMIRTNGLYVSDKDEIENAILGFQDTLVNRQVDEVSSYIRRKSTNHIIAEAPSRYIGFSNRHIRP